MGDNCIGDAIDFLIKFKGEERKVNNKTVEYNLQLQGHNASGFDTWIVLKNFPCDKNIFDFIKNRKGIISLKTLNGYI